MAITESLIASFLNYKAESMIMMIMIVIMISVSQGYGKVCIKRDTWIFLAIRTLEGFEGNIPTSPSM